MADVSAERISVWCLPVGIDSSATDCRGRDISLVRRGVSGLAVLLYDKGSVGAALGGFDGPLGFVQSGLAFLVLVQLAPCGLVRGKGILSRD
jgi:hypothetical protein